MQRNEKLRRTLLTNGEKLSDGRSGHLNDILEERSSLAVRYAMKEEMIPLFRSASVTLRRPQPDGAGGSMPQRAPLFPHSSILLNGKKKE